MSLEREYRMCYHYFPVHRSGYIVKVIEFWRSYTDWFLKIRISPGIVTILICGYQLYATLSAIPNKQKSSLMMASFSFSLKKSAAKNKKYLMV